MPRKSPNRTSTTVYLDPSQIDQLKKLSENTRVPQSVYIREAIDDLLNKYNVKVPKPRAKK